MGEEELKNLSKEGLKKRAVILYALVQKQKNSNFEKDSEIRSLKNRIKYLENKGEVKWL